MKKRTELDERQLWQRGNVFKHAFVFLLEMIAQTTAPASTNTATHINTIVIISLSESGVTEDSLTVNVLVNSPVLPASSLKLIVTVYVPAASI